MAPDPRAPCQQQHRRHSHADCGCTAFVAGSGAGSPANPAYPPAYPRSPQRPTQPASNAARHRNVSRPMSPVPPQPMPPHPPSLPNRLSIPLSLRPLPNIGPAHTKVLVRASAKRIERRVSPTPTPFPTQVPTILSRPRAPVPLPMAFHYRNHSSTLSLSASPPTKNPHCRHLRYSLFLRLLRHRFRCAVCPPRRRHPPTRCPLVYTRS